MTAEESSEDEDENPFVKKKDPATRKLERIERAKRHRMLKLLYVFAGSASLWFYLTMVPNPFNEG